MGMLPINPMTSFPSFHHYPVIAVSQFCDHCISHSCDHSMSIFILWSFCLSLLYLCLSLNNYVNWNVTLILKKYTIHFAILANVVYCHDQYVHMLLFSDVETFLVETLKIVKLNSSAKDHKDRLLEKIRQLLEEISGSSSGQLDSNASSGSLKISGGKGRKLHRPVLIKKFHLLVELFQICICYCL